MAYIWENYSLDKYYVSGKRICPYMEIYGDHDVNVHVNPLLRFAEIFELLHVDEITEYADNLAELENVVFHYLAQLDKTKGMDYLQGIIEKVRNELCDNYYGETAKQYWSDLNYNDQETILYELARRLIDDKDCFFMDAIEKLFPLTSLCYERDTEIYYLYIGADETDYNINKCELVKYLFWNKNYSIKTIWKVHYGIVGIPETMTIGSIQIIE